MITVIPAIVSSFIFPVCQAKRDVCISPIVQASHKENLLGLKFLDQAQQPPGMPVQSMNLVSKWFSFVTQLQLARTETECIGNLVEKVERRILFPRESSSQVR